MKRGEIYLVNLPESGRSIQSKLRPAIVISNDLANKYSPVIHVCPISSKSNKNNLPTHVELSTRCGLITISTALCEQSMLISKDVFIKKIGQCDNLTMLRIDDALKIQFGLTKQNNPVNDLQLAYA